MLFPPGEFAKIKEHLIIYTCALKNISMRFDILLEDFSNFHIYNPIEHIKTRVKSPESIAEKLHRQNFPITAENARKYLTDIAGMRCICSYAKDIAYIADVLRQQPDITVLSEKDYVTKPKPSGYRSYHLILEVPIYLTDRAECLPVEVQIRTQAMDFWASLEHKVKYKYKNKMPEHISSELVECAEKIADLDNRMYLIQEIVDMAYLHKDATVDRIFNSR
ncbi:MAG: GTP pyrophosphokinase family protein [Defluviitaleaceae bacterium]|nr:GTP pyrophosphokinase family protein [Defluviitaleaceae bacterium]